MARIFLRTWSVALAMSRPSIKSMKSLKVHTGPANSVLWWNIYPKYSSSEGMRLSKQMDICLSMYYWREQKLKKKSSRIWANIEEVTDKEAWKNPGFETWPPPHVPLCCSHHVLMSSVICCWTDAREHAIYLTNFLKTVIGKLNAIYNLLGKARNTHWILCSFWSFESSTSRLPSPAVKNDSNSPQRISNVFINIIYTLSV